MVERRCRAARAMAPGPCSGKIRNWKQKKGDSDLVWVSYRTGKVTDVDAGTATNREPVALFDEFKAKFPNLLETFARRHKQLSVLYDSYWRKRHASLQAKSTKVGRNDPCPCGSEKKYKKCCG